MHFNIATWANSEMRNTVKGEIANERKTACYAIVKSRGTASAHLVFTPAQIILWSLATESRRLCICKLQLSKENQKKWACYLQSTI